MFFIAAQIPAMALHAFEMAKHDRKMFELSIADLDEDGKKTAWEKRRLEQREDQKHRELCQAIRDTKPSGSPSLATALFGGILIGSMFD